MPHVRNEPNMLVCSRCGLAGPDVELRRNAPSHRTKDDCITELRRVYVELQEDKENHLGSLVETHLQGYQEGLGTATDARQALLDAAYVHMLVAEGHAPPGCHYLTLVYIGYNRYAASFDFVDGVEEWFEPSYADRLNYTYQADTLHAAIEGAAQLVRNRVKNHKERNHNV